MINMGTPTMNISIPQLVAMFITSAKSREQALLTKHDATQKDIARVDKYIRIGDIDDDNDDDNMDDDEK